MSCCRRFGKFLVDAQLRRASHDYSATPVKTPCIRRTERTGTGRRTRSARLADEEGGRGLKDRNFRDGHLLRATPRRLLIVATGNTSNEDSFALVLRHLGAVVNALNEVELVELRRDQLITTTRSVDNVGAHYS